VEVRKSRFGWGPGSDDMTSLYFDRQIFFSPTSCWIFGRDIWSYNAGLFTLPHEPRSTCPQQQQLSWYVFVKCRCYIYMDEMFTLQLARASDIWDRLAKRQGAPF
jgi:hypothetical protein